MEIARKLVLAVVDAVGLPTRGRFADLWAWTPLFEQAAFRCSSRLTILLDMLRPEILQLSATGGDPRNGPLADYWHAMHGMLNARMLTIDPGARPWLVKAAVESSWGAWTPTFPLLRERTVWSAVCAAHSAMAFGDPVVEKYVHTLAHASHPMRVFDALYALCAIALSGSSTSGAILSEVRSIQANLKRRFLKHPQLVEAAFDSAVQTMRSPDPSLKSDEWEVKMLDWTRTKQTGLATPAAIRSDPATIMTSGGFLGFKVLPFVVDTPRSELYPVESERNRGGMRMSADDVSDVVLRAWGVEDIVRRGSLTLH